jgi:hypothetical protein
MSDQSGETETINVDLTEWREKKSADPEIHLKRQASEIILYAIAICTDLQPYLLLKGGTLMGIAHQSPRQTVDIDFTMTLDADDSVRELVSNLLNGTFRKAAAVAGNDRLDLVVQHCKWQPKIKIHATRSFPALKLKIGYSVRGTPDHKNLLIGKATRVVEIDVSFNEPRSRLQILELGGDIRLLAYSWIELVAEKFRALLQQVHQHRPLREAKMRRQDVYDIDRLITKIDVGNPQRAELLLAMLQKCHSKNIKPEQNSFDDPELKSLSKRGWNDLSLEVDELPDFDSCYARVLVFYRSLPWSSTSLQD